MILYWVLLAGQVLVGLYGSAALCEQAQRERTDSTTCVERRLN